MNPRILESLKLIVRTLRNAADVIEAVTDGNVTPAVLEKAANCGVGIVSIELDSLLSFIAGMRKGKYAESPSEMLSDMRSEATDAVEQILANQAK